MSVNIFGSSIRDRLFGSNRTYVDKKFAILSTNLATKIDKSGDTVSGDLNIELNENNVRTFGVSDIGVGKSVSLLLGNTDNQIRHNFGYPIKIAATCGTKFTCPAGDVCRLGGQTSAKAKFLTSIGMNDNFISNLHDPSAGQDAATKKYVDTRYVLNNVGFVPDLLSNNTDKRGFIVTASSEKNSNENTFSAYKAFSSSGEWCTDGVRNNFWIQLQCPTRIRIHKVALRGKHSGTERIYDWKLQGNNINDSVWHDLHIATNTYIGNTINFFNISTSVEYRNYRIFVVNAEGDNPGLSYCQLYTIDTLV